MKGFVIFTAIYALLGAAAYATVIAIAVIYGLTGLELGFFETRAQAGERGLIIAGFLGWHLWLCDWFDGWLSKWRARQ